MTASGAKVSDIQKEYTGVSYGTLAEDFMATAAAVKQPFCRVEIPSLGWSAKSDNLPLVYVPFQALAFALKKGASVAVKFSQDDLRFPYLWKYDFDATGATPFPAPTANSPQPSSGAVAFPPQSVDEYSFQVLAGGLLAASNGTYDCIRKGDSVVYFWSGGISVYAKTGAIGLRTASGYINIAQSGTVDINGHLTVGV